jgi:hypothetical protein
MSDDDNEDEDDDRHQGTPVVYVGQYADLADVPAHPKGWEIRDTYDNPFCHHCAADPCVCNAAELTAARNILVGKIIVTSYGSGPYRITGVSGPCRCPRDMDSLEETWIYQAPRTEPHFHLTMKDHPAPAGRKAHDYYLSQYRRDGTSVTCDDAFFIVEDTGQQLELGL